MIDRRNPVIFVYIKVLDTFFFALLQKIELTTQYFFD